MKKFITKLANLFESHISSPFDIIRSHRFPLSNDILDEISKSGLDAASKEKLFKALLDDVRRVAAGIRLPREKYEHFNDAYLNVRMKALTLDSSKRIETLRNNASACRQPEPQQSSREFERQVAKALPHRIENQDGSETGLLFDKLADKLRTKDKKLKAEKQAKNDRVRRQEQVGNRRRVKVCSDFEAQLKALHKTFESRIATERLTVEAASAVLFRMIRDVNAKAISQSKFPCGRVGNDEITLGYSGSFDWIFTEPVDTLFVPTFPTIRDIPKQVRDEYRLDDNPKNALALAEELESMADALHVMWTCLAGCSEISGIEKVRDPGCGGFRDVWICQGARFVIHSDGNWGNINLLKRPDEKLLERCVLYWYFHPVAPLVGDDLLRLAEAPKVKPPCSEEEIVNVEKWFGKEVLQSVRDALGPMASR